VTGTDARDERGLVSTGKRRAAAKRKTPRALLVALTLGAIAAGVAWYFLVGAAIEFGRVARRGQDEAWLFAGAATVGATVCLLLVFVLAARVLAALGLISDYRPRRSSGKRAR
jgi:uncharacterized membrane protein YecN with MAPEG domain